jgi:prepilin-type N-terminal cleavage/methylation domain-containing protein
MTMKGEKGFTLIELLLAMAISATIMGTALLLTTQVQKSYASQVDGASVQQEARYAMDWITRALQSAGSNPEEIMVSACPAAGTTFRSIRRDPNADGIQSDIRIHADIGPPNGLLGGLGGACIEAGEDVTIAHNAVTRTITRRDNNTEAAAVNMSDGVITLLFFQYIRANGAVAVTDDQIATVRVTIGARTPSIDQYTGQFVTYTLVNDVRVRSR